MKATFQRMELLGLAKAADSIAPNKTLNEALSCTLLEAGEDGMVTVAASDPEMGLEQRLHADVVEEGNLLINARLLFQMLSILPGDTVEISGEDGEQARIQSGSTVYLISVPHSRSYPRMEIAYPGDTVPVTGIPAMAKRTVFAVSESDTAPLLRCVNLLFRSDGLHGVSCDGMRMAAAKGENRSDASISLLIPASALGKLARLLGNKDTLQVGTTGRSVVFSKENFLFSARRMEGSFINADMVLGRTKSTFTVLTDAKALLEAISCADSVSGTQGGLCLRFDGSKLTVRCESENGTSAGELSVIPLAGNPDGEYWYPQKQLAQCLRALGGTLMLEVGQGGALVMRTDDLICLQNAKRKPAAPVKTEKKKAASKAA